MFGKIDGWEYIWVLVWVRFWGIVRKDIGDNMFGHMFGADEGVITV